MMKEINLLVIDGQGGKIGSQLISLIRSRLSEYPFSITAVGTNSTATGAMLKAGADYGATGENPVIVACRSTDVIIGPLGIVIADSLIGEVTAEMAAAVGRSTAVKILIPVNKCNHIVAGVTDLSTTFLIEDVIEKLKKMCN